MSCAMLPCIIPINISGWLQLPRSFPLLQSAHCHWIYNETHDDNMWRWQSPPVVLAGWLVDGVLLNDLINGSVPLLDTISTN